MSVTVILDTPKQKPQQGELFALGNGKIADTGSKVGLGVKSGDKIFSWKYSRLG